MTLAQEHHFSAGFSPNSSPEDAGSMLYDDDSSKDLFDFDEKPKKNNGRKGSGPGAADKRATHNAIERARRESLNGRFMTLAEALPSMASVKRPSKSIIVNKALDFVFEAQVKEHALIKENNELRLQVDQLRARLGMQPLPPPTPLLPQETSPSQQSSPAHSVSSPTSPSVVAQQQAIAPLSIPQLSPPPMSVSSSTSGRAADSPALSAPLGGHLAGSLESLASSSMFAAAAPPPASQAAHSPGFVAPMALHQHQAQQYAQMLQSQAYNGYMNPSLLSQQQLMLAAHLQQQPHPGHAHGHHLNHMNLPAASMQDFGSSHGLPSPHGWGPEAYSPHQPFFMS